MGQKFSGAKLLQLRRAAGLTQDDLADRAHVSKRMISKYETGVSVPAYPKIERLAEALGVEVTEISDDAPLTENPTPKTLDELSPLERELVMAQRAGKLDRVISLLSLILEQQGSQYSGILRRTKTK